MFKKVITIAISFCLVFSTSTIFGVENTYKENVKWLDESYESTWGFSEGLASVSKDGKYGVIDTDGNIVIPFDYDWISFYKDDLVYAVKGKRTGPMADIKSGLLDREGNIVVALIYTTVLDFSEGLAAVEKDGKFGYIDKEGKEVVSLTYDYASSFSEGFAEVSKGGKVGFIDKEENEIVPFIYDDAWSFSEGIAAVSKDGKWGFIDKEGKEALPFTYDFVLVFYEGIAVVSKDEKWGYMDKKGNVVIPLIYDGIGIFSEGLVAALKNDKWGFIDREGNEIIPFAYDWVEDFSEGLAVVKKNDKYGVIDKSEKVIIPFNYDKIESFSEGATIVEKEGRFGILSIENQQGEIEAVYNTSKVLVDGEEVSFDAYTIDDNNYFKLRDIAKAVTGSDKQFEVTWDNTNEAINLLSNQAYTTVGGELEKGDGQIDKISKTTSMIYMDGESIDLLACKINDNNYFKLRDVAEAFDIGVTWDEETETIGIDTSIAYNSTLDELEMTISKPTDRNTSSYSESIIFAFGAKDPSYEVQVQINEILTVVSEDRREVLPTLGKPYHIETNVTFVDGKTIITNSGTYTDEAGEEQPYEKELVFDFIVTENVRKSE